MGLFCNLLFCYLIAKQAKSENEIEHLKTLTSCFISLIYKTVCSILKKNVSLNMLG